MLSVVIPTYNERQGIEELLNRLAGVQALVAEGLEVLLVDDRSTDGTDEWAEAYFARAPFGRVIRRQGLRDLSQAVLEGIRQARGELIAVMDGDLSHPPELLPALADAVRAGQDLAVASRYVQPGPTPPWSSRPRRLLSQAGNLLVRPLVPVRDATSGYFVAESAWLKGLGVCPHGFKILLEILVRGCVHRAQEVPYVFTDRRYGTSKLGWRVLWAYLAQVGRLYLYRWRHPCRHASCRVAPSVTVSP